MNFFSDSRDLVDVPDQLQSDRAGEILEIKYAVGPHTWETSVI